MDSLLQQHGYGSIMTIESIERLGYVPIGKCYDAGNFCAIYASKVLCDDLSLTRDDILRYSLIVGVSQSLFDSIVYYERPKVSIPIKKDSIVEQIIDAVKQKASDDAINEMCPTIMPMSNASSKASNKAEYIPPHRLVMVDTRKCHICNEQYSDDTKIHYAILTYYTGWLVCQNCIDSGVAKQNVLAYINDTSFLPLFFLFDSKTYLNTFGVCSGVILKFWRSDVSAVYFGTSFYSDMLSTYKSGGDLITEITFYDGSILTEDPLDGICNSIPQESIQKIDISKPLLNNTIPLKNLILYNPNLYQEIVECENLFGENYPIKIGYSDLDEQFKNLIAKQYADAMMSDGRFE